jgi:hypothetical protein
MGKSSITGFHILPGPAPSGRLKRSKADQVLRMDTPGGSIFLRQSAVEQAGGSWARVTGRMQNLAKEKAIPFQDETK